MCDIGKPIEIIQVEPLNLPAPVPRHDEEPEPKPFTPPVLVPVPITVEEETVFDEVTAYIPES